MNEKMLSVEEAAAFLQISKRTIYKKINELPHYKRFGRLYFSPKQLVAFIKNDTDVESV